MRLYLAITVCLLSGCSANREMRLAGGLAETWLPSAEGDVLQPLVVCGVDIPQEPLATTPARPLSEKIGDTAKLLLFDAAARGRLTDSKTVNSIVARGPDVVALFQFAVEIGRLAISPMARAKECDEFDAAAVKDHVLRVQGLLGRIREYEAFLKKYDANSSGHRVYLVAELSQILRQADEIERSDIADDAKRSRAVAKSVLAACHKRPDYDDCDFRLENERRKQDGETLLDYWDYLAQKREQSRERNEMINYYEQQIRYGRNEALASVARLHLISMGVWDATCGCVSPNIKR